MASYNDVLDVARGEIGYCRYDDPLAGTKYGRWYADLVGDSYYGTSGVPFCAMFASWVLNQAGVSAVGMPSAYCPYIVNDARAAGVDHSASAAAAGDIVLFDWDPDGVADHVGFVESNNGSTLTTIEGNTTGADGRSGSVARRSRAYSTVVLCFAPNYDGATTSSPSTSTPTSASGFNIEIDGQWGCETTRAVQTILGTEVDGTVDHQYSAYKSSNPGLLSQSWKWETSPSGYSPMVRALQNKLGVSADGYVGPVTIKALQNKYGTGTDGKIDNPSPCVRAMQTNINNQGILF